MSAESECRVPWQETSWTCDVDSLNFQCTDELTPLDHFIGQDRALEAIRFGLEVDKPGYNLFVTGLTGTGKASAIKAHLESLVKDLERRERQRPIGDWVYVYNFEDPDRPRALRLPVGIGRAFRSNLSEFPNVLKEEIPKVLQSEEYEARRRAIEDDGRKDGQELMAKLEQEAQAANFSLQVTPSGITLFPMLEDRPMTPEEYQALAAEPKQAVDETREQLMQSTQATMPKMRDIEKDTGEKIKTLEREAASLCVSEVFRHMMETFGDVPAIWEYLVRLIEHVLDNLGLFKEQAPPGMQPSPGVNSNAGGAGLALNPFLPFEVNVLVDNSGVEGVPIVIEPNPTWGNLFGRIERRSIMGTYVSDHAMLKSGSIHRANGGYLVLNARDMLMYPAVWEGLKRIIRNREIQLEDPAEQAGYSIPQGLRPEPISLDLKVIATGDEGIYRTLSTLDQEDFGDLFKVKAEFDYQIELTPENIQAYCAFICWTCQEEQLLQFDAGGAARVIEYAARQVSDQNKLSTRFGQIKDLLIEADYWARKDSCSLVQATHVRQAKAQKIHRLNLVEERLREMIAEGSLLLEVTGSVVGQINGLAVYDLGDFSFGRPSRITAQTFAGREGVINIEREASLSGRTHDKGVLILGGFLGARYGQERPLTLTASMCFEQSYDGVDGDSASSTELYAIISSLSGLPIKQSIAVTGSVNQKGEIQPIGGVNQKVEGMFDVCRIDGLTGDQGVMIPYQNKRNLMLREDVAEAVKEGTFNVYAVKTIDEGLEILTGVPAGKRQADGSFPKGTVNQLVEQRLKELHQSMRGYYGDLVAAAG
ncbi:MAG: AAA family ATPase [Chloroflexi bacterium]|nr:AAA family ATPase [Chloroflexota bacterium]